MASVQTDKLTPDAILEIIKEAGGKMEEGHFHRIVRERFAFSKKTLNDRIKYLRSWRLLDYNHDLRTHTKTFTIIEQASREAESAESSIVVIERRNIKAKGYGRYCPGCLQRLTVFDEKPVKRKYVGNKRHVYTGYFHKKCASQIP